MLKFIAELCQNHNGDEKILDEMIHQAAEAGATHIKIQTIFADDLTRRPRFEEGETINGEVKVIKRPFQLEYDRLKKLELSYRQQSDFVSKCKKLGVLPLTTCFTRGSIRRIAELGMSSIKVASYDCSSYPLIRELSSCFESLIISTGATFDEEIAKTAEMLDNLEKKFTFLHCVTKYPTPLNEIHLNRLNYLKQYTSSIGLSDHTLVAHDGIKAALAAIYFGVDTIERHFTILPADQSKDGPVSIRPEHLKQLMTFSRYSRADQKKYIDEHVPEYAQMLGSQNRALSAEELRNRDYYRGRFATHVNGQPHYNWEE